MIYKQSTLMICDNSGAKLVRVFHLYRYPSSQKYSCNGDVVLGSVIKYKAHKKMVKKQICKVLLTTSKQNRFRKNGNLVRFDKNGGVVLLKNDKLLGTRVFGPVSKDIRRGSYSRLLSLAQTVI